MSGRPHGRAEVNVSQPRAWAVCDRCGMLYNHVHLRWQFDWRGPKLQNLRFLVCNSCYDSYQQNGQRTIILPADPVPIQNARIEYYVADDNPLSAIGADPLNPPYGNRIGTMASGGGVQAAFDGNPVKTEALSASITVSDSSYGNYVGIDWVGQFTVSVASPITLPTSITHSLSSFTAIAPWDTTFGSTSYVIQGSSLGSSAWTDWTTISSGSITGTNGETISGSVSGGSYRYHRIAFLGNGTNPVRVAQVTFSVSDGVIA